MQVRARSWAAVAVMFGWAAGLGGCGSGDDVVRAGSCPDPADDAFLVTAELTEGTPPAVTDVPVDLIEIEEVEVAYTGDGGIRATVDVVGDITALARDVDAPPPEQGFHWSYQVGITPDVGVRAEVTVVDGRMQVDATLSGTFQGEAPVGGGVVRIIPIEVDVRPGEGLPVPGYVGDPGEPAGDGPLTIDTSVDGDRFTFVVGEADEYIDVPDSSFQRSTAFSPGDKVQDDCSDGIVRFDG